jgi:acyl-CoA reductase-like NAD-dependent aldehyde dehydrogenase
MGQQIAPEVDWSRLCTEAYRAAPEAWDGDGSALNLIEGAWGHPGQPKAIVSAVDGRMLGHLPMIDRATAARAVGFAATEARVWAQIDLAERQQRVTACLDLLRAQRELLARLLVWEIGKPYAQALSDVDRCISGVAWYVDEIAAMLEGRRPLGLISNIASWNYPLSVLVHAVLVQVLVGNSAIAKTPTDGGVFALTVAFALARRSGLPVSLVSGAGGQLSDVLVRSADVDCLAFVGGRTNGRDVAASLYDHDKRYMLEMEGINAYGIWEFSDWPMLADQIRRGFDYAKQRCTAYTRFVVQRRLFPRFLDMYLSVLGSLRCGNPTLVDAPGDALPTLDFGPLISRAQAESLRAMYSGALAAGAISLHEGVFDAALFLPDQDMSAYFAPAALLNTPQSCELYYKEPFGPIDTIVVVDRIEQLINEMNISNGALVASIACDDERLARRLATDVRAFKVGINAVRSRGDRAEVFGGIGQSWQGCFVGGKYLVQAVSVGHPGERLFGNFSDYRLLPESR